MSDYVVGAVATLTYQTRVAQVLTDATTVAVEIQLPDGTTAGPFTLAGGQVVRDSVGTYRYLYTPTMAGKFAVYWTSTGAATGSTQYEFDVAAKFAVGLANISEAKAYLNKSGLTTTDDVELQSFLDAASDVVTQLTGITGGPKTAVFPLGAQGTLLLPDAPVAGVTVVDSLGATVSPALYTVNPRLGTVTYGMLDRFGGGSAWWPTAVTVTYTTHTVVPAAVRLAVLDLTADLWRSQRGVTAGLSGVEGEAGPRPRWRSLLEPFTRPPAIA